MLTLIRYEYRCGSSGPQVAHDQAAPTFFRSGRGSFSNEMCSMSNGHLFSVEIITAAIFTMLIYAAFLPLTN